MNHKAQGPNGRPVGSLADNETVADLIIAYDEALRSGSDLPDKTAGGAELEQNVRQRLETAKECLSLIERVRQFRQSATPELSAAATSPPHDNAYSAGGDLHRIGRFEIVRELGRGSHGVVFLARDPGLSREIALKVPRPEAILTPQLRSRFLREGKAAARLNHPNILPVHEAGEAGPICYLVQSYCSGPSLAAWLASEKDPVSCKLAARIVAELADGVEQAHQQGILHRDIKPANVMIEMRGARDGGWGPGEKRDEGTLRFVPKLTDFGLAKALDDDPNATATLGAVGTVTYMPPEQAAGQLSLVGPRSDVYSLGALLYELLTRRPPIAGVNQLDTLRLIASEEPRPIRERRADVPRELEAVCLKCLEKSPEQRYGTAAELAADLRRFLNGDAVTASPQGRLRRMLRRLRRQPVSRLAGGVAMMLLVAGLGLSLTIMIWSNRHSSTGQDAQPSHPQAEYVAGLDAVAQGYLDAVANHGDTQTAVRELDTFLERHRAQPGQADYRGFEWHSLWRLCHPEKVAKPFPKLFDLKGHKGEVYFVTFSGDGTLLATAGQDHTARIWDATTGKLHSTLTGHGDDVNWISFHAQAWHTRWVATASDDKTVRIWNCDTGKCLGVLSTGQSKAVAAEIIGLDRYDHASGEVRKPAYEIVAGDHAGRMLVWDFATQKPLFTVQAHAARIEAITPFRQGCWFTASDDGTAWEWSGASGARLREHAFDAAIYSVACNSDSTLAAFAIGRSRNETGAAYRHDASGQQLGAQIAIDNLRTGTPWLALTGPGTRGYESIRFFPGRCLLIAASRNRDPQKGAQSLLVWDPPSQKYWNPVEESLPTYWCAALSPDGSRLATAATDGIVRVWDSSELPTGTRLPGSRGDPERRVGSVRYSPDGRKLLVTHANLGFSGRGDSFVLWNVTGKRPKLLHSEATPANQCGSLAADFSRDGRLIAVADTQGSGKRFTGEIRVLQADSRREIARSSGYNGLFRSVVLSYDGRTVAAATKDESWKCARLCVWNIDQSTPKLFRESKGVHFLTAVLSPDGSLLATNEEQVELYQFPSMRLAATLPIQLGGCGTIAFSPDGKTLAAGGESGIIHLYDLATHASGVDLRSDGHAIMSLAFSPDSTRLAAGLAGTPRVDLWHLQSGKRLAPLALPSDSQSVSNLAFSPDQRTLAAAGIGGTGCVFLFPLGPVDDAAGTVRRAETGDASRWP